MFKWEISSYGLVTNSLSCLNFSGTEHIFKTISQKTETQGILHMNVEELTHKLLFKMNRLHIWYNDILLFREPYVLDR